MPTIKELEEAVAVLFAPGEWFMFPRRLLAYLTWPQVGLFSCLANRSRIGNSGGWFYATAADITRELYMLEDAQYRAVQRLVELKLIETELRGSPPKRYFKINFLAASSLIVSAATPAETRELTPAKTGNRITQNCGSQIPHERGSNKKVNTNKGANAPSVGGGFAGRIEELPKSPARQWAEKAAMELYAGLAAGRRLIGAKKPIMETWICQFEQFISGYLNEIPRIQETLTWFAGHFTSPGWTTWERTKIPQVKCARTFCERFVDIEDARMRRTAEPNRPRTRAETIAAEIEEENAAIARDAVRQAEEQRQHEEWEKSPAGQEYHNRRLAALI